MLQENFHLDPDIDGPEVVQWATMEAEENVHVIPEAEDEDEGESPNDTEEDRDDDDEIPSLMSIIVDRPDAHQMIPAEEVVLPRALEEVLARHVDIVDEVAFYPDTISRSNSNFPETDADSESEDNEDETGANDDCFVVPENSVVATVATTTTNNKKGGHNSKVDRNKKKKERKKKNRKNRAEAANNNKSQAVVTPNDASTAKSIEGDDGEDDAGVVGETNASPTKVNGNNTSTTTATDDDVHVEYVPEKITVADLAPMYRQFYRVFEIFRIQEVRPAESLKPSEPTEEEKAAAEAKAKAKEMGRFDDDDDDDEDEDANGQADKDEKDKLSKRKQKKLTRLSVAELKQLVTRPDVVEMHDVTARDPKLLVQLKSQRNTVPVPRHWCFKRKYLQGKRGIEKPPFDLPAFIKKTGIMEMRASLQEKDESKTLKAKMRERVRPKMGKIDIDYQKLHDAFFKWQTKPRMSIHGDLYYEGKEFETR